MRYKYFDLDFGKYDLSLIFLKLNTAHRNPERAANRVKEGLSGPKEPVTGDQGKPEVSHPPTFLKQGRHTKLS